MTELAPVTKTKKSASRIGAVQSLYSSKMTGVDISQIIANFVKDGSLVEMDGISFPADYPLYEKIISKVLNRRRNM